MAGIAGAEQPVLAEYYPLDCSAGWALAFLPPALPDHRLFCGLLVPRTNCFSRLSATGFGRDCGWAEVFRHYHTFARTLLDRLYIFAGQGQRLDIRIQGLDVLDSYVRSGRGCLLVGAHFGSFEIARAVGVLGSGYPIKALVYGKGTPRIAGMYKKLNPSLFKDIINMGDTGSFS